jgi:hypothetical protein
MFAPASHPFRTLLLAAAATLMLSGWHAQASAAGWFAVVPTCASASLETVQNETNNLIGGYTVAAAAPEVAPEGRNPPLQKSCTVWNPGLTAAPGWAKLHLLYLNPNTIGGNVKATLYQKSLVTGAAKAIATARGGTSSTVAKASGSIKLPVDFSVNAYYVVVELSTDALPVQAHTVMLE